LFNLFSFFFFVSLFCLFCFLFVVWFWNIHSYWVFFLIQSTLFNSMAYSMAQSLLKSTQSTKIDNIDLLHIIYSCQLSSAKISHDLCVFFFESTHSHCDICRCCLKLEWIF
jgi:hypothetical protein